MRMCLISFNWDAHPIYKLILVANRDEFLDRPTSSLHLWESGIYAGKDLKGGGTWLGFHPKGKFAALTNYRDLKNPKKNPVSRGNLVKDFLENEQDPFDYLKSVQKIMNSYEGFNLLVADNTEMGYLSNNRLNPEKVSPGVHGISNAFLDTPWPKVESAKADLINLISQNQIEEDSLINLLQSQTLVPDELLPFTGVSLEMERILSAQFIKNGNEYGTVNTTVLLWKHDGNVVIKEKRVLPKEETRMEFKTKPSFGLMAKFCR